MPHSRTHACVVCHYFPLPPLDRDHISHCPRCDCDSAFGDFSQDSRVRRASDALLARHTPANAPRVVFEEGPDRVTGMALVDGDRMYSSQQVGAMLNQPPDWVEFLAESGVVEGAQQTATGWLVPARAAVNTLHGWEKGRPAADMDAVPGIATRLLTELARLEAATLVHSTPLSGLSGGLAGGMPLDPLIIAKARLHILRESAMISDEEAHESGIEVPFFQADPRIYLIATLPAEAPEPADETPSDSRVLGCFSPASLDLDIHDSDAVVAAMERIIAALSDEGYLHECWILENNVGRCLVIGPEGSEPVGDEDDASTRRDHVQRMLANPIQTGLGGHPATVPAELWCQSAADVIDKLGARAFLTLAREELNHSLGYLPPWLTAPEWLDRATQACEAQGAGPFLRDWLSALRKACDA